MVAMIETTETWAAAARLLAAREGAFTFTEAAKAFETFTKMMAEFKAAEFATLTGATI